MLRKNVYFVFVIIFLSSYIFYKFRTRNKQLVSHNLEPIIGDTVINNNPSCKHYKSIGKVTNIVSLKHDAGKVVVYKVNNKGTTYCPGQTLIKTLDQLTLM